MVEKTEGQVEQVNAWKTGKGYFLSLVEDEREYYGFGSPKMEVGDNIAIEISEGTGNFSGKWKVEAVARGTGPDKGIVQPESAQLRPPKDKDELEELEARHRTYTLELMARCVEDASEVCGKNGITRATYAVALFKARVKHLHYYIEEAGR